MRNNETIILHISDIHRSTTRPVARDAELIDQLLDDIRNGYQRDNAHLPNQAPRLPTPEEIDLVILSGDITQRAEPAEFAKAAKFLEELIKVLPHVNHSRVVIVPGNHDVCWEHSRAAYEEDSDPTAEKVAASTSQESNLRLELNSWPPKLWRRAQTGIGAEQYRNRLKSFKSFLEDFYGASYATEFELDLEYTIFDTFAKELGMVVVGFSSCGSNDHLWRRGWIDPNAILSAAAELDRRGLMRETTRRLAVWHHNVFGSPDQPDFMDPNVTRLLAEFGFSIGLHGHMHETVSYRPAVSRRELMILGAGSLAAERGERPESVPLQYNVIGLNLGHGSGWVHIRARANMFEPWHAHNLYGPNRNMCWLPIEIPDSTRTVRDVNFYPSIEQSDFSAELAQMISASQEVVFIGTGLGALTHSIRSLLIEHARTRNLSATICFGNPYSPNVRARLVEEERGDVLPDVAAAGILSRAKSLIKQAEGIENIKVKFFNNYPTLAIFKFDEVYYTYPMGYRTLGNRCPVTRVPPDHPQTWFLNDMIHKYLEDAVDAEELLRVRSSGTRSLDFVHPDQIREFAVYLIPDPASRFYQIGARLLARDLFDTVDIDSNSEDEDIDFFNGYSSGAANYGFHLTVLDVMYVEKSQLPSLICEVTEIAKGTGRFSLKLGGLGEDQFWKNDLVLRCSEESGNLELLHYELVNRVLPLSLGTNYTLNPDVLNNSRLRSSRDRLMTRNYFTPYILQNFRPHFTLASNFNGTAADRSRLRDIASERILSDLGEAEISIDRIYVLSRALGEERWQLNPIDLQQTR